MPPADWLTRINYLGKAVNGTSYLVTLQADDLIAIARTTTGLNDFGDNDWQTNYYAYVDDVSPKLQHYFKTAHEYRHDLPVESFDVMQSMVLFPSPEQQEDQDYSRWHQHRFWFRQSELTGTIPFLYRLLSNCSRDLKRFSKIMA